MIGALLNDCDRSGTDDPATLSADVLQTAEMLHKLRGCCKRGAEGNVLSFRCSDWLSLTEHLPPGKANSPGRFVSTSHPRTFEYKPGSASRTTNSLVIVSIRSVPVTHQCYAVVRWQFVGSYPEGTSSLRSGRFARSFEFRVQGLTYSVQRTAFSAVRRPRGMHQLCETSPDESSD